MSFFNSKPWAKIPTDLLENKAMMQIERRLPENLRYAPVLFYLAGAAKADEDGIFDIGDGAEFAELIKVQSPGTVTQVAGVMVRGRVFAHVPDSPVYLFVEWEYPVRTAAKTLRQRFDLAVSVWRKRQSEDAFFHLPSTKVDSMRDSGAEAETPEKPRENTIHREDDECLNAIHGAPAETPQIRREQNREDERRAEQIISEEKKSTHTRVEGAGEERAEPPADRADCSAEEDAQTAKTGAETERLMDVPPWTIVPEPEASENPQRETGGEKQDAISVPEKAVKILGDFFKANNAAYSESRGAPAVERIARLLAESCGDGADTAEMAARFCREFKAMHDQPPGDYWHNVPLMPAFMLKERAWYEISSRVARIYGTAGNPRPLPVREQAEKDWREHLETLENPANSTEAEYTRFGIDPADPDRVRKMLIKRAMQGTEVHFGQKQQ